MLEAVPVMTVNGEPSGVLPVRLEVMMTGWPSAPVTEMEVLGGDEV